MHTTMIRASITAYSTAVGPSSAFRKFTTRFARLRMSGSFLLVPCPCETASRANLGDRSLRGSAAMRTVRTAAKKHESPAARAGGFGKLAGGRQIVGDVLERLVG